MSQVRVGVRIRPLTVDEQAQGGKSIVNSSNLDSTVELLDRKFTFDSVYDETVPQDQLYKCLGSDRMLEAFLEGYNSTIMAYGQTGSGKTFTMGSEANYSSLSSEGIDSSEEHHLRQGLIPRFMSDIFTSLQRRKIQNPSSPNKENISDEPRSQLIDFKVSASFLEVYGENIHDLLSEDSRQVLPLREDEAGKIVVVGLKEQPISSAEDALQVLNEGTLNRTTAATLMNKKSSRSHAVFTIHLRQKIREINPDVNDGKGSSVDVSVVSCFTFVDLAGSERMKKTGAEGERAKEGIMINQGLLALGNVINALADEERLKKGKKVHVPYRESKLTRLLQDALGGNSQTLFLACISPSDTNASETASTLKYANRARNIRNAPTKNIDATLAELQRLYALNQLLERELIQSKFGNIKEINSEEVGTVDDELLERDDVKQYLSIIHEKANEKRVQPIAPLTLPVPVQNSVSSTTINTSCSSNLPSASTSKRSQIIQNIDDCVLGVDPDGDIALLDKLLELQRLDQEFESEAQKDQEQLEQVVGELAAQEQLLLQLKTNLQGYHHLKDRFESMMVEIQSLENEKKMLAKELENAQIDPSKGCSKSIKKRLENVESKLERTRVEGKKYQQLYRKAEHEAKKAATLQQKIDTLKQGKVALVKKQREAVAKYKELSDTKAREINMLKRKERKTGQQLTKLETEIRNHKMHLQRRNEFCSKLSEKLKQTEAHLMKVLSMRKRDMLSKTNTSTKAGTNLSRSSMSSQPVVPDSEEISSMKFLLDRLIHDRVNLTIMRSNYESKVSEYSDLMRTMVTDMKELKSMKDQLERFDEEEDSELLENNIQNLQDTIEDTEFRIHALEKELDKIKSKLPGIDDPDNNEIDQRASKFESDAMHMINNLSGVMTKHLLKDMINVIAKHQATKFMMDETLKRKDAALMSFENEIESLNKQITVLSQDRESRKSTSPSLVTKDATNSTVNSLKDRIMYLEQENNNLASDSEQRRRDLNKCEKELCIMKEKFTVLEVTLRHSGVQVKTKIEETIKELQVIWELIGISSQDRELVRHRIDSCLEFSCSDELQVAKELKQKYEEDINNSEEEISKICKALGVQTEVHWVISKMKKTSSLIDQLKVLQDELMKLRPTYMDAIQRRSKIALELKSLMDTMRMNPKDLSSNLSRLLSLEKQATLQSSVSSNSSSKEINLGRKRRETQFKHVEDMVKALEFASATTMDDNTFHQENDNAFDEQYLDEANSLSDEYLEKCQCDLKILTMKRAEIKVTNQTLRESAKGLANNMHLRGRELLSLSLQSMKKRDKEIPSWWNSQIAEFVCRSIVSKDGVVEVNDLYTKHLSIIHEALQNTSIGRRELSITLRDIVHRTHESLLHTVEAQLEDNEAYTYFDEALARLPPFSKEYVAACIDEMRTLIAAVDAMYQSEVEALTVVWDALNVRNSEKGDFWGQVEESSKELSLQMQNPFESVLKACKNDVEEWLYGAVKEAQTIYRSLNAGVIKLNKIHEEVERLSEKQSVKSKIISIDSELRVLSIKLGEFEEKANSRQRLTQKSNSASLLKEERFRKQMQNEFSSKLKTLWELLSRWESIEGSKFDEKLLSNEVSLLLENDKIEEWVQRRTAFMHLKTVQQKSTRKHLTPNSSPKRPKTSDSTLSASSNSIRPKTSNTISSNKRRHITRARSTTSQNQNLRKESPSFQNNLKVLSPATNQRKTQSQHILSKSTSNSKSDKKNGGNDNTSPPLANNPFGRILAKTPTSEKENFKF